MLSDQQQYRYMTVDDMKSMGDDSMRVNVTDDERDNRHSGGQLIIIHLKNYIIYLLYLFIYFTCFRYKHNRHDYQRKLSSNKCC